MKYQFFFSKILPIASLCLSITTSVYVWKKVSKTDNGFVFTKIESKIINAKEPYLSTVTIVRELNYSGEQISKNFNESIRGQSYLVVNGMSYSVIYSPHLQNLEKGTKIKGWFQPMNVVSELPEGKLEFIVPIELISCEYKEVK